MHGSPRVPEQHLTQIRELARELLQMYGLTDWSFEFDRARTRAGLCNFQLRRISVSRHYSMVSSLDDVRQVLLHEIAHALVGKAQGHGRIWRAKASSIGYQHRKIDGRQIAQATAPWAGICPGGHQHFRYKRPARATSCLLCAPEFSLRYRIDWQRRDPALAN